MKRTMLWLCVLLVAGLLGYAWVAYVTKPRMPVVGMTEDEVERIVGPGGYPFGRAKLWDTDTGSISVDFDDQRRLTDVRVFHMRRDERSLCKRFREWLGL